MDGERIERLEAEIAHQGRTIEDLNATVTALWRDIEELRRVLHRLEGRVGAAEGALGEILPPEPPPPHY